MPGPFPATGKAQLDAGEEGEVMVAGTRLPSRSEATNTKEAIRKEAASLVEKALGTLAPVTRSRYTPSRCLTQESGLAMNCCHVCCSCGYMWLKRRNGVKA